MTTNLLVTLTWALATNSTLVGKVRHVEVPLSNGDPTITLTVIRTERVTLTYRHDLSSNLVASFSVAGTTQQVQVLSVPVKSWNTTTETFEVPQLSVDLGQGYSMPLTLPGVVGANTLESLSITTP